MLLEHWRDRWQRNEIGFHQGTVNPYLVRHWPRLQLDKHAPVFVPLCGKSLDMLWLHGQGHPILGVEISPIAIRDFFAENGMRATAVDMPPFIGWTHDGIQLLCGDYFDVQPRHVQGAAGVYDRASMIALPEEMRQPYADHLIELTWPHAPVLLVALAYPEGEMNGPPFSVTGEEITARYAAKYRIELLETAQTLDDNPRFRERGLSRLEESTYLLIPRARRESSERPG